jgi:hypothetical protein
MNTKKKYAGSFLLSLILLVMAGLSLAFSTAGKNPLQTTMKYDGTYSLYVSFDEGITFNWITNQEQNGVYSIVDNRGRVLAEGTTDKSRVHQYKLDRRPNREISLEFGGEESGTETVKIHPEFDRSNSVFRKVDSLFVVGDVHGSYDKLINLLQKSNVIGSDLKWIAGSSHLMFVGDLFDRGNDVTKVLWFIHELEEQAEEKGGMVHLILGNHEIMTITNDLRYIGRKEKALSIAYGVGYDIMFHPVNSYLGSWLRHKSPVIKIDDVIFAHGGIIDLGTPLISEYNEQAFAYMSDDIFLEITKPHADSAAYDPDRWMRRKQMFYSDHSPFWYRGYAQSDTLEGQLDGMLKKYKSKLHVVGHTPFETITQRYNGKFITTDLNEKATELLLLIRKGKKYKRFKIDSEGQMTELVSM